MDTNINPNRVKAQMYVGAIYKALKDGDNAAVMDCACMMADIIWDLTKKEEV